MKFFLKSIINRIKKRDESGQMLLFVLVVILLLLIIVLAIVVNVRVDIKETQMEREYEMGYAIAEEQIFKIASLGYADAKAENDSANSCYTNTGDTGTFCPGTEGCAGGWVCTAYCCKDSPPSGCDCDSGDCFVDKVCTHNSIFGVSINQDETLEVDLGGQSVSDFTDIFIDWDTAEAISLMVVYKDGPGNYLNQRLAMCREGNNGCYTGFINYDNSLNLESDWKGGVTISGTAVLMRIRAIGGQATNVTVTGSNLPVQMDEVRVQGFTEGVADAKGLSAPEVTTLAMKNKRLPALFDYVLFVANDDVTK
ncbi:hypothetical protein JW766_02835 [Candidatus Dojkabacteria bacterium]|nr:hypothetical protein [Candidatus Dojkabacteria bacterium]